MLKQAKNSTFNNLSAQVVYKLGLSWEQVEKIIDKCVKPTSIKEIMYEFNRKNITKFRGKFINPFLDLELLQMSLPESQKAQTKNILLLKKEENY